MLRRNVGVGDEKMNKSMDSVRRIQQQRMQTKRLQPLYKIREAFLIVTEVSMSMSFGSKKSEEEY